MNVSDIRAITRVELHGFQGCVYREQLPSVFEVMDGEEHTLVIADDEAVQVHAYSTDGDLRCWTFDATPPLNRVILSGLQRDATERSTLTQFLDVVVACNFEQII